MPDQPTEPEEPAFTDALPDDLDVEAYVGPYQFPDIRRRRIAGTMYVIVAAACGAGYAVSSNGGLLAAAVMLGLIAAYHFAAAWPLAVDQTESLAIASRTVGFPVGHASAQLGWRGLRSRPAWRILLYSADEPPSVRGLVELDAVDGRVLGEYTEANPEDWSQYGIGDDGEGAGVKQLWEDFKSFIMRGNVFDLAVAVVIGAAFKAVIDSFVNDVFTPLIGAIVGKPNFNDLVLNLRGCRTVTNKNGALVSVCKGTVNYGSFLTSITNFLIIAAAVFVMIKAYERLQRIRRREEEETGEHPLASDEVTLLTEIRDLLRDRAE